MVRGLWWSHSSKTRRDDWEPDANFLPKLKGHCSTSLRLAPRRMKLEVETHSKVLGNPSQNVVLGSHSSFMKNGTRNN